MLFRQDPAIAFTCLSGVIAGKRRNRNGRTVRAMEKVQHETGGE